MAKAKKSVRKINFSIHLLLIPIILLLIVLAFPFLRHYYFIYTDNLRISKYFINLGEYFNIHDKVGTYEFSNDRNYLFFTSYKLKRGNNRRSRRITDAKIHKVNLKDKTILSRKLPIDTPADPNGLHGDLLIDKEDNVYIFLYKDLFIFDSSLDQYKRGPIALNSRNHVDTFIDNAENLKQVKIKFQFEELVLLMDSSNELFTNGMFVNSDYAIDTTDKYILSEGKDPNYSLRIEAECIEYSRFPGTGCYRSNKKLILENKIIVLNNFGTTFPASDRYFDNNGNLYVLSRSKYNVFEFTDGNYDLLVSKEFLSN